jgi:hypothetical protein
MYEPCNEQPGSSERIVRPRLAAASVDLRVTARIRRWAAVLPGV